MQSSITQAAAVAINPRDGYEYRRLVSQDQFPYNVLVIDVCGTHNPRRVLHGIRNYYVISGDGNFIVAGVDYRVGPGTLVVINPGEVYSYTGTMQLLEFNIPTEGKIAHEDV